MTTQPIGPWPDVMTPPTPYWAERDATLKAEISTLTLQLAHAKHALALVLDDIVGPYAESQGKAFTPDQWQRMNAAMDKAKAVMHS